LKDPPPSDWLALLFSIWIAPIEKALNCAVLIMPDRWRKAAQEAEMGDSAGVKVNK
jgi:hypothetical protein